MVNLDPIDDEPESSDLVDSAEGGLVVPPRSEQIVIDAPVRIDQGRYGHSEYLIGAMPGIMLAGFLYPSVLLLFFAVGYLFMAPTGFSGFHELLMMFFTVVLLGGMVGALFGTLTGALAVILIWAMNRSLGNPFDKKIAAISAGSLAGYVPTIGAVFPNEFAATSPVAVLGIGVLGPALAMLMGAVGAAWSARHMTVQRPTSSARQNTEFKLTIMHLMVGTFWVAATFALANSFGSLWFAATVAGWFVLNGILIGCVHFYRNRMSRAQSKSPKTLAN